ncbi:hypothetical protein EOB59_04740 [Mesorhizobium sp. M7A.F.Ca.MR.176.00.0.0]|uniref:hypothetical protein n=1 Tax=unclassified Mesorhizobium TaxID=325217 RepID=UPI000FD40880|nr:hypothetical protein [Mesorhizobium sp. M7A.F.Ca.MR.176.00.0.0]RUU93105.1 hypothetical protein EOB59_04740 [Mesorhizobium sp. M7A.F.Ca.MR.176.00.0.0]
MPRKLSALLLCLPIVVFSSVRADADWFTDPFKDLKGIKEIGQVLTNAVQDAGNTLSKGVKASRMFSGPGEYPPENFGAYGILAFPAKASEFDKDRHLKVCQAYLNSFVSAFNLDLPPAEQMVTVWPINDDNMSDKLNAGSKKEDCEVVVSNFGLSMSTVAIDSARRAGWSPDGKGPFLIAWAPGKSIRDEKPIILYEDMSKFEEYGDFVAAMNAWKGEIQGDNDLFKPGWNLDNFKKKIRDVSNKYGKEIASAFGTKGG